MCKLKQVIGVLVLFSAIVTIRQSNGQVQPGRYQWQCKNQHIIASDELCDGKKHCSDGSDETTESCLHIQCPKFSFRCSYGACVGGTAACDNIQDCADNSDEASNLCGKSQTTLSSFDADSTKNSSKCPEDSFKCENGDCVSGEITCDGKADCKDGSDELAGICSASYCPAFAFRCGYGACVSGDAKCDGTKDCVDNSDESPALCGSAGQHQHTAATRPRPPPSREPSTTSVPTSTDGCKVDYIADLKVSYQGTNQEIPPGQYVDNYITVQYTCRPKHLLQGSSENSCFDDKWTDSHPKCIKYCPNETLSGVTIQSICERNRTRVSCKMPILPGTQVTISCQFGYQKTTDLVDDILYCGNDGNWDNVPYRCVQVCGEEQPEYNPFILGGTKTNITKVPWHAGIWSNRQKDTYEQICGGTIVNAKIIISAAHCFWDPLNSRKFDKSHYRIGVGKYKRDYNAIESLPVQFQDIAEIHITDGYQDVQLSYINDIAVLVLTNYIDFKFYIRPACLAWSSYSEIPMKSNIIGRVAGWGTTATEKASEDLRSIELASLSYDDCRAQTQREFQNLITGDKFCVGSKNGETVCTGDSGGGFVIPKMDIDGNRRYYLQGIVSNGINSMNSCTGDFLTAYTNIQFYQQMVKSYMEMYKAK